MENWTTREIKQKYGEPDWIGTYQNNYATKVQWFYHLGGSKVRYVFFVEDKVIWDLVISEDKMLRVIYEDNQFIGNPQWP